MSQTLTAIVTLTTSQPRPEDKYGIKQAFEREVELQFGSAANVLWVNLGADAQQLVDSFLHPLDAQTLLIENAPFALC